MISWEYIAGFFDGEGFIQISVRGRNRQTYLKIGFSNNDEDVLKEIQEVTGGKIWQNRRKNPRHKPSYLLNVIGLQARAVLLNMLPSLRIKKRRAELALEFCDWRDTVKQERHKNSPLATAGLIWKKKMNELNQRGMVN
jgi:hypothetical protein